MSFNATVTWEVRTSTGSNFNGGGFDKSYGGTDYSQLNWPIVTGTVTTSGTTCTATTGIFTSAMVGNVIASNVSSTQKYTIISYTSATQVTLSGSPAWTSVAVNVGGALASVAFLFTNNATLLVNGHTIYATGSELSANPFPNPVATVNWIGYSSTRGDGGKYKLTATSGSNSSFLSAGSCLIENIIFDGGNNVWPSTIFVTNGTGYINCTFQNLASGSYIILSSGSGSNVAAINVYFNNCTSNSSYILQNVFSENVEITNCTCNSFTTTTFSKKVLLYNNTCTGINVISGSFDRLSAYFTAVNTFFASGNSIISNSIVYSPTNVASTNLSVTSNLFSNVWYSGWANITGQVNAAFLNGIANTLSGNPFQYPNNPSMSLSRYSSNFYSNLINVGLGGFLSGNTVGYEDIGGVQHPNLILGI